MKMGNIASPWLYDAVAGEAIPNGHSAIPRDFARRPTAISDHAESSASTSAAAKPIAP
jgi:hypothetical protein